MATFASKGYSAIRYQAFRPTYPAKLFETIYNYHAPARASDRWERCADLGCGTGQTAREVSKRFTEVIGVDPSTKMIETAREASASSRSIQYVVSRAEELPFLKDSSVDLVTASQSAHWFDYAKLWPELGRVLKPGGSVAFWSYPEMFLSHYLDLNQLITAFSTGSTDGLGGCWEEPGYSIIHSHLESILTPGPPFSASSVRRIKHTGPHFADVKNPEPVILKANMSWADFEAWMKTWSAVHTYQAKHPEDKEREDGDVVERFIRRLREAVLERGGDAEMVELDQPLSLLLLKKESQ